MAKFLLGIAIVAFTSFLGYLLAKKYRKRKDFFVQFTLFNERFLSEISYRRRPLSEFFRKYAYKGEFLTVLQNFFDRIKSERQEPLTESGDFDFLTNEQKSVTEDYFLMLGRGDSSSQKAYFSAQKETLINLEKQAKTDCKRYGDLFVKIGFLCGLLILILII